jgi:hypothetical protein
LARLRASVDAPARGQFADRITALNAAYRALAVTDYTWAKRLPDASCAPEAARARLLNSDELSSWLASLLGTKVDAATALDKASAGTAPSGREYALLRARARRIGEALSSDKATGSARAALYCRRAQVYESLSAANRASVLTSAARKADSDFAAGVYVLARRVPDGLQVLGAATAVEGRLVTDERLVRGESLLAFRRGEKPVPVRLVRRGSGLALLEGVSARGYTLADAAPAMDDLIHGIGHLERTGAWTETRGLVTASGSDHFQTDAVIDAGMTGGAALTEDGKLAGIFVLRTVHTAGESFDWPVAVSAPALQGWLAGEELTESAPSELAEAGSSSILTASRSLGASLSPGVGAVAAGSRWTEGGGGYGTIHGSCPTCPDGGGGGSSSSSYDTSGAGELGKVMGQAMAQMIFKGVPALFRGIGKVFSRKPKSGAADQLVDNRHYSRPAEAPKPPPDPLRPSSLSLSVSRTSLAQGEEVDAVATIAFTGKDGTKAGHSVSFTVVPGGKLNCPPGTTDTEGAARVKCQAIIVENERIFDSLLDEERRRRGLRAPERVQRRPAKGDSIAALKERAAGALDKLVIEEEKQPMTGTDTPGLDKTIDTGGPEEYVVKGDRVTLSATLSRLLDQRALEITDRPCPAGLRLIKNRGEYSCGNESASSGQYLHKSESPDSAADNPAPPEEPNETPGQSSPHGTTPDGRPYTHHYGEETGPERNIPGSVVDHIIESVPPHRTPDGKNVRYDSTNDITVVTGRNGIISVHPGKPRKGQMK